MQNHKKCFFSFISRPILIVIALFGRAELRTLKALVNIVFDGFKKS